MSDEPRDLFMPMTMKAWGSVVAWPGLFAEADLAVLCSVPGSVGYIPLYASIEALQAVHGLVRFQRLRGVAQEAQP